MITKIKIKNIQYHEFLEIEFSKDLNILFGKTGTGKSVVFKALLWVCNMSNISADDIRRENTEESSVKIWLDNGFQIERIKSDTINRYILSKEGCEDKVFDTFGKNTPEEIQVILGLKEIEIDNEKLNMNFAYQDQLNFILDSNYSDGFKAKLFNKLTGNELLDIILKDLNKDSLSLNKSIKDIEEQIVQQENDLAKYSLHYNTLNSTLCMVTNHYKKLNEDIKIYEELQKLSEKLKDNKEINLDIKSKINNINIIADKKINNIKDKIKEYQYVVELTNKLTSVHTRAKDLLEQKSKIRTVNYDFNELITKNNSLNQLQDIANKISDISTNVEVIKKETQALSDTIMAGEKELQEVWKLCEGICPLCKQEKHEI